MNRQFKKSKMKGHYIGHWALNEPIGLSLWTWEEREFQRRSPNTWALASGGLSMLAFWQYPVAR